MKKKDIASLQSMKATELAKVLVDAKTALAIFTMNRYTKQSKNVHEGTALRRKIARILTYIRQKELSNE